MSVTPPSPAELSAQAARLRTYAWSYFAFHAEQRMKTFHFYLLLVAAMISAFISLRARAQPFPRLEAALCFLATFVSLAFYLLERRNRELVRNGEAALRHLDEKENHDGAATEAVHPLRLFERDDKETAKRPRIPLFYAHYPFSVVLKGIFFVFGVGGFIAGIYLVTR